MRLFTACFLTVFAGSGCVVTNKSVHTMNRAERQADADYATIVERAAVGIKELGSSLTAAQTEITRRDVQTFMEGHTATDGTLTVKPDTLERFMAARDARMLQIAESQRRADELYRVILTTTSDFRRMKLSAQAAEDAAERTEESVQQFSESMAAALAGLLAGMGL